MKRLFFVLIAVLIYSVSFSQRYYSKSESDAKYATITQLDGKVNLADSIDATTVFYTKTLTDSIITTDRIQFTVGVTPGAASLVSDSVYTDTRIIGGNVDVYLNGAKLTQNSGTINYAAGFVYDSTTGKITVKPVFESTNKIIIDFRKNDFNILNLYQNLFVYSEQLDNATYWFGSQSTVTANQAVDLNGNMTLEKIQHVTDAVFGYVSNITVKPSTTYVLSFDYKNVSINTPTMQITDITHAANIFEGSYFTGGGGTTLSRVTKTFTTPAGCVSIRIRPDYYSYSTGGIGYHYMGRMQLAEQNTEYITTTTTPKN